MNKRKTICVDFDGVIHDYMEGWKDGSIYGQVMPGAIAALQELQKDYEIVIYTTRASARIFNGVPEPSQLPELTNWLREHGVPYDSIFTGEGKPVAVAYIDDRAVRFNGDWSETLEILKTGQSVPWNVSVTPSKEDMTQVEELLSTQLTATLNKHVDELKEPSENPEQFYFEFYKEVTAKLNTYFPSHKFDVTITSDKNNIVPPMVVVREAA